MTAPRRFTSPWRFFAAVAAAALVLAALERTVTALRAELSEPGRGACWIWAPGVHESVEPLAFFAVRDFDLDEPGHASLTIVADEEYVVYLNGRRVGSGSYRDRSPADLYEVGDVTKAGGNRLAVELRSSRGAGGLLANLRLGQEEGPRIVTDGDWRVFRRYDPAILHGWRLEGGEPATVWRGHPAGRWRPAPAGEARPWPKPAFPPEALRRAVRLRPMEGDWRELSTRRALSQIGVRAIYDWGEELTGVLHLELASDGGEAGLLYVGTESPENRPPPADALVVPVPGRASWSDAHVRTFRYAYLVGVELREAPEVRRVDGAAAAAAAAPGPWPGILGIVPPRAQTLAEEQVRERLFGVAKDR